MRYAWWLVGLAGLLTGCSSAESFVKPDFDFGSLRSVAVVEVAGSEGQLARDGTIGDLFIGELVKRGFNVIERARISKILEEQQFQASSFASAGGQARAGKVMNVDALLIVNVPKLGNEISINARMVQAESGLVLFTGTGSGSTRRGATTAAAAVVGAGVGAVSGRAIGGHEHRTSGAVIGGVAGAAAGGIIGYALEPQQAAVARKVVRRVCVSLPNLAAPTK